MYSVPVLLYHTERVALPGGLECHEAQQPPEGSDRPLGRPQGGGRGRTSWGSMKNDDPALQKLSELEIKAVELKRVADIAAEADAAARGNVEGSVAALELAESEREQAERLAEELTKSQDAARAEDARMLAKVEAATAAVVECTRVYNKCGADEGSAVDAEFGGAHAATLKKLSDAELNELRKLHSPPEAVRRALQLVHTMLTIAEGGGDSEAPECELKWVDLQRMIGRDDFVKRVLTLEPTGLSRRPISLLHRINERWPALEHAVAGPTPSPSAVAPRERQPARAVKENAGQVAGPTVKPPAAPKPGARPAAGRAARRLAAAAHEALAAQAGAATTPPSSSSQTPKGAVPRLALTLDACLHASRPCGAIFQYCAECAGSAIRIARERDEAAAAVEAAQQRLAGVRREHSATQTYVGSLESESQRRAERRQAAEAAVAARRDERLDALVSARLAATALETARQAAAEATRLLEREREALERRRQQDGRRASERAAREVEAAAAQRAAQAAIERDLATRPVDVCIHQSPLPEGVLRAATVEFTSANSSALPPKAAGGLSALASALCTTTSTRVHLAGHAQSDEDSRIAAQRAMAVGGALIALGVLPLQLRAKGYAASAVGTHEMARQTGRRSLRCVTVHSLAEVRLHGGIHFAPRSAELSDQIVRLLGRAAEMLQSEHRQMRLCVEGHTDTSEEEAGSAIEPLSDSRADAVASHLESLGIASERLVSHGFGAAFPVDDNATDGGRQHNRRVELLVIPPCLTGTTSRARTDGATALSGHLSNRPGVTQLVGAPSSSRGTRQNSARSRQRRPMPIGDA